MPRLTVKTPVNAHDMLYGPPDGTTPIDGATKRIPHQYFSYNATTGQYGAGAAGSFIPQKFYELTAAETHLKLHPDYAPTTVWAFDGQVPGPLIQAKYGEPIMVRFHNHLPSVTIPQAFGIAEITTHLHNAHTPSESDGNPVNFFNSINDTGPIDPVTHQPVNPHGFKDQHYPNVLAGFTDPRFAPYGDPTEAMSSLWYHDHHLDFTAQNVYKGMFGCYTLFDDKDTGDGTGLRLPHGEFDVPIFFNDFLFDSTCQQVFDLFNLDGILGDRFLANGAIQPFFDVKKCRYRLRLYNPGPSRWYEFALYDGSKLAAVLADQQRRQSAAAGDLGDQRARRRGRAGRHHCRLQQDQCVTHLSGQPAGAGQRPRPDRQDPQPRLTDRADQPERWPGVG